MLDYLVFLIYKVFVFMVKIIPKPIMKYILHGMAKLAYLLDKKHKHVAKVNLDLAFEDTKTNKQKDQIIKDSYVNIFYNLYEFVVNPTLTIDQLKQKVDVENEDIILDAIKKDKKIILITAHYGNWELVNTYNSAVYKPMTVVGRPMSNKYLNKDLRDSRNQNDSQMLDKDNAAKGLVKALKQNRMIALVVDQNTASNMGILIDFFGKKARQTEAPAKLASKFDALIIPVFVIKDDFCKYTMKFCPPIDVSKIEDNSIKAITQVQADIIEKQIKTKPEDWFWQHQRWKNQYEERYKI
jgi:KDO2-lipid IV(A) lauroyltransferase